MSNILLFIELATSLLALVSLLGIAWARRHDRHIHQQARSLQRRLEVDVAGFRRKGQRIRQRIVLVADLYCRGAADSREMLTRGVDELLAEVERLRGELYAVASRLGHARRGDIRQAYSRTGAMRDDCRELGRDLEERDRFWKKQLAGMTSVTDVR